MAFMCGEAFVLTWGPLERPHFEDSKTWLTLPDVLARSKDLFQSWRYAFEFSPPDGSSYQFRQFEYCFLRCAAEVMRVEVRVRLSQAGAIPPLDPLSGESRVLGLRPIYFANASLFTTYGIFITSPL